MKKKGVDIFSLQGKTALVTGATGHLGLAMSKILAEAGAHLLINSRSYERSVFVVDNFISAGLSAEAAVFDIKDVDAIEGFFSKKNAPLHILVNNAYSASQGGTIESSDLQEYSVGLDSTVKAAHQILISALPYLRRGSQEEGGASVINIASMYGLVSPDQSVYDKNEMINPPHYGAMKAALLQWTRYAACEFGHENIRVNSISPGPFPSEKVQKENPDFIEKLAKKVPMARIGYPEEMQGAILFLASPASSFVNGSNLIVDGGWTCW